MDTELSGLLRQVSGRPRQLRRGELLFREAESGESFYLVRAGRLRVFRNAGEEESRVVGEVGRGELVGEMAVLGDTVRSASVIAVRDTQVIEVSGGDLAELPKEVLLQVLRILAQRLRRMLEAPRRAALPSCIAIVPAGEEVPLTDYSQRLLESLQQAGAGGSLLRSQDLPSNFRVSAGSEGEAFQRLGGWLEERESEGIPLLLQTDFTLTPWTERCLSQADLVLLVARASSDPEKGPIERALQRYSEREARPSVDLVLLQETMPYRGTDRWLAGREIRRHHHVRLDSAADKARAGRLLTGTDISFALGGGGARGFAHVGILRACEELGIPVDRVCGTSMGAIIGGLKAMGLTVDEMSERIRENFFPKRRLTRFTLPAISLDTGRGYIRMLERLFGDTQIEDLPINYFCVSCNLTCAGIELHRRGNLAKWVGASISVPGIAPPLVEDGELFVDGGLLNNLPVDIARSDGAGFVVGVDVSPETEFRLPANYSGRPQAFEALASWLPWRRRSLGGAGQPPVFPSIAAVLNRANSLSSVFHKEQLKQQADCYIKVPVDGFKLLAFEELDAISEIGCRTGHNRLPAVKSWLQNQSSPTSPRPETLAKAEQ